MSFTPSSGATALHHRIALFAALGVAAAASLFFVSSASAVAPVGVNGKIFFETEEPAGDDGDIFSMSAAGSGFFNLTNILSENNLPSAEEDPTVSPNGLLVVFNSDANPVVGSGDDLWISNADGTDARLLFGGDGEQEDPSFTPDGKAVVFENDVDGDEDIWRVNIDGTGAVNLTQPVDPGAEDQEDPDITADGKAIVYEDLAGPGSTIVTQFVGGGLPTPVTGAIVGNENEPQFSPDGKLITFDAVGGADTDIYVINRDGTGARNVTEAASPDDDSSPSFSPDGKLIAFDYDPGNGDDDIGLIKLDGTGLTDLTDERVGNDEQPAWEPIYRCGGIRARIVGSDGAGKLKGTKKADTIVGNAGKDKVKGLGAGDRICGGLGKDTLIGGAGKDRLFGQAGRDVLRGGAGGDVLRGGKGKDKEVQ
jgi:Tol biopolymer transport system component